MFKWTLLTVLLCGGVRLAQAAEQDPNAAQSGTSAADAPKAAAPAPQDANAAQSGTSAADAPKAAAPAPQDANAAAARGPTDPAQDANAARGPTDPAQDAKAAGARGPTDPVQDANAASDRCPEEPAPGDEAAAADATEAAPSQLSQPSQKKTLVISSNPVDALVSIDGVEMGPTPLTVDRTSLGDANSVMVRWTHADCDPHEMQVLLDPNNPEIDVGAYLYRRKQHALGVQYTGYFAANIAHGAAVFYRHYFPYHLFATAGLGVTTVTGSSAKAMPLVLLGVGYDSGSSHDDPELPGLDRSNVAFTPSLEGELVGPSSLAGLYLYPVSVRAYYAFASFGIGYQFNHTALYSGFGCRLNVGAQWTFF